jgi:hypothetical protein
MYLGNGALLVYIYLAKSLRTPEALFAVHCVLVAAPWFDLPGGAKL